jgi:DNA-binding transcriptional regulator YdaS (Cro superfamily)
MKPKQPRRDPVLSDPVLSMVRGVRGTAVRIAAACGINRETVWNWQQVPAKHVLAVESALAIPRHLIRPDIYPPPYDPSTRRWLNSNRRKQHGARTT